MRLPKAKSEVIGIKTVVRGLEGLRVEKLYDDELDIRSDISERKPVPVNSW